MGNAFGVVTPENWADYDVIFIGYLILWQEAAWSINDFVEENDFSGKQSFHLRHLQALI